MLSSIQNGVSSISQSFCQGAANVRAKLPTTEAVARFVRENADQFFFNPQTKSQKVVRFIVVVTAAATAAFVLYKVASKVVSWGKTQFFTQKAKFLKNKETALEKEATALREEANKAKAKAEEKAKAANEADSADAGNKSKLEAEAKAAAELATKAAEAAEAEAAEAAAAELAARKKA